MINYHDDDPPKSWWPYILGTAAVATLSTLGSELVRWGVDELRQKFGTKKPEDKSTEIKK